LLMADGTLAPSTPWVTGSMLVYSISCHFKMLMQPAD
jgi:hypothetical protein